MCDEEGSFTRERIFVLKFVQYEPIINSSEHFSIVNGSESTGLVGNLHTVVSAVIRLDQEGRNIRVLRPFVSLHCEINIKFARRLHSRVSVRYEKRSSFQP